MYRRLLLTAAIVTTLIVHAGSIDSLYTEVMKGERADFGAANSLMVALNAEGAADSLYVFDKRSDTRLIRRLSSLYMGNHYHYASLHHNAINAYDEAARLAAADGDFLVQGDALSGMAIQYHLIGDLQKAIATCRLSLHIDSLLLDPSRLSTDFNTLAGSSLAAGRLDDAEAYILRAIEVEKRCPTPTKLPIRYGTAAEIYNKKGEPRRALEYAEMAYQLDYNNKNEIGMARRMSQMADIYTSQKEYAQAETYYLRAIDLLNKYDEIHSLAIDYKQLGNLAQQQGHYAKSIEYYKKAAELADEAGNRYLRRLVMSSMSDSYHRLGDNANAYASLSTAMALSDSIHTEQLERLASEYSALFQLDELKQSVEAKERTLRRLRTTCILLVILLVAALIALTAVVMRRKRGTTTLPADTPAPSDEPAETAETAEPDTQTSEAKSPLPDHQLLVAVADYVNANMKSGKISIDRIADHFCMSRKTFSRRITAATGESPISYITQVKMKKAKLLLNTTTLSVKEIAFECGFDEPNYFIYVFRKTYGMTPQQFRITPTE